MQDNIAASLFYLVSLAFPYARSLRQNRNLAKRRNSRAGAERTTLTTADLECPDVRHLSRPVVRLLVDTTLGICTGLSATVYSELKAEFPETAVEWRTVRCEWICVLVDPHRATPPLVLSIQQTGRHNAEDAAYKHRLQGHPLRRR
jgi:hypothetical protein